MKEIWKKKGGTEERTYSPKTMICCYICCQGSKLLRLYSTPFSDTSISPVREDVTYPSKNGNGFIRCFIFHHTPARQMISTDCSVTERVRLLRRKMRGRSVDITYTHIGLSSDSESVTRTLSFPSPLFQCLCAVRELIMWVLSNSAI
jgi:hypothetical protein